MFQDDRFVVLDKPAGLPCHAGPRGGASVEDWFPQLSRRRTGPWLAHRLDADTSGCLVIALKRAALLEAQSIFATGGAGKTYWAIVTGRPSGTEGRITSTLAKHSTRTGWRMVEAAGGQQAITEWRLRGTASALSWLELHPRTGRTHQVRIHCASLGCPILGDPIYGPSTEHRLHLLARAIHLPTAPPLTTTAPPPASMQTALQSCGWTPDNPQFPP